MIKRQTGLDDFTFNLRILDKALNTNDAYGAIKDIWRIVESDRGWVDPHWRINDDLFKNKVVNFSLADALSPVKALGHYLWGNGQTLEVDINTIGLNIIEHKLPLLRQAIENTKSPGAYHLVDPRIEYNTFDDSVATGAYLGRITLNMAGDFTRSHDGAWRFIGTIKAYHDRYDFNASNRPRALEELTTAGRALPGKSYEIDISGEHKIHLVGMGYKPQPF
nr:lipid II-degrading bacteriocin [Pseudomonas sp. PGPR40]